MNITTSVPIFVLTCDRIEVLKQSLASYRQIRPAPTIVIHDNGSTYPPMLEYLAELERQGTTVVRSAPVNDDQDLNRVAQTIDHWFERNDASHYVVTDPDIALEDGVSDILSVFATLLARFPQTDVVGPMLRIDDIPDHYPLKFVAAGRHYYQFWQHAPERVRLSPFKAVNVIKAKIDTTFGLYRKGFAFHRYNDGLRVHAPYWARHLDWYIDPSSMSADQIYYMEHASKVSHWGGTWLRGSKGNYVL